jgi:hypothetical protein
MTRRHDDLHLALWSRDGERVRELLTAADWRHTRQEGYSVYELDDVRLEVAFLDTANGRRTRSSTMSPRWRGFVRASSAFVARPAQGQGGDDRADARGACGAARGSPRSRTPRWDSQRVDRGCLSPLELPPQWGTMIGQGANFGALCGALGNVD